MKGLLLKDFILLIKYCFWLCLCCIAMVVAVSISDSTSYVMNLYPTMIMGIIPMTLLSYDERHGWTQYSACLPYTRTQIVLVKYLDALLLSSAMAVLSVIVRLLAGKTDVTMVAVSWALRLVYVTLLMPFAFRFGTEKARIVQLFGIGILAGVSVALSDSFASFAPPAAAVIVGVVLALFAGSFLLASAWYSKREL